MQETWVDPRVEKISWRRKWQPFQNSCLENLRDRRAWWAKYIGLQEWNMTERLSTWAEAHTLRSYTGRNGFKHLASIISSGVDNTTAPQVLTLFSFVDEGTEARKVQWVVWGSRASKWQSQNLELKSMFLKCHTKNTLLHKCTEASLYQLMRANNVYLFPAPRQWQCVGSLKSIKMETFNFFPRSHFTSTLLAATYRVKN